MRRILLILLPLLIMVGCSSSHALNSNQDDLGDKTIGDTQEMDELNERKLEIKKLDIKKPKLSNFNKEISAESNQFKTKMDLTKDDEQVNIHFVLENISGAPMTFEFSTSKEYDFFVYNQKNELVYQWSEGRDFLMVIKEITLDPGDKLKYDTSWPMVNHKGMKVEDGEYRIEFKVTAKVQSPDGKLIDEMELYATGEIDTRNMNE